MKKLQHIAFVMDGNRRWAADQGKPTMQGHKAGADNAKIISELCVEKNIEHITLWALSTENLEKRGEPELEYIFSLIKLIPQYFSSLKKHHVQLDFIGALDELPSSVQKDLEYICQKMRIDNPKSFLHIALNYGGKKELLQVMNTLVQGDKTAVTENDVEELLYTKGLPPVDLVVRTGGKQRLSGLLPWQTVYAELYFTQVYWPSFDKIELDKALEFFMNTQRNFGS